MPRPIPEVALSLQLPALGENAFTPCFNAATHPDADADESIAASTS
jgi:hypothetical protein